MNLDNLKTYDVGYTVVRKLDYKVKKKRGWIFSTECIELEYRWKPVESAVLGKIFHKDKWVYLVAYGSSSMYEDVIYSSLEEAQAECEKRNNEI
jgi:hypothetical protein